MPRGLRRSDDVDLTLICVYDSRRPINWPCGMHRRVLIESLSVADFLLICRSWSFQYDALQTQC